MTDHGDGFTSLRESDGDPERAGAALRDERVLAICRAVWPIFHPGTKYDGWSHWPNGQALHAAVTHALSPAPAASPQDEELLPGPAKRIRDAIALLARAHDELARFFREEESEWGEKGDYENWSTERAAIELIRHLRAALAGASSPEPSEGAITAAVSAGVAHNAGYRYLAPGRDRAGAMLRAAYAADFGVPPSSAPPTGEEDTR